MPVHLTGAAFRSGFQDWQGCQLVCSIVDLSQRELHKLVQSSPRQVDCVRYWVGSPASPESRSWQVNSHALGLLRDVFLNILQSTILARMTMLAYAGR